MKQYTVQVQRHYTYEVAVEASDEVDAIDQIRDFEIEDLEPYETDAYFSFDVSEYPEEETNE